MATEAGGDAEGAKQVIRCQYPGCLSDLTKLKRFNLRCKICEEHCKADSVVIDNVCQRFCQQCNKFHDLNSFDGTKKGCRDKLEKHNKRRRNHRSKDGDGKGDADGKRGKGSRKKGDAPDGMEGAATTDVDAFNAAAAAGGFPPLQNDFQQVAAAAAAAGGANGAPPYAAGMQNYLAQLSQHAAAAWAAQATALNFPGAAPASSASGAPQPPTMMQPPTQEQLVQRVDPQGGGGGMPEGGPQPPGGAQLSPEQLQRYMLLASYANYMNGHP